jgi:flagellar assembly protein FliH
MSEPTVAVIDMISAMPRAAGFNRRQFGTAAVAPIGEGEREARAFAAGFDEGHRVANETAVADRDALLALITKAEILQPEASDELSALIGETIFHLVTEVVGTAPVDRVLIERRIAEAVALISECDRAHCLFLHPDDLALVKDSDLSLQPVAAPDLARGDLRIECSQGWIEHGSSIFLERLRSQFGILGERA